MTQDAKQFWNERAEGFFANQKIGAEPIPNAVAEYMNERGWMNSAHVLDVGSGSGRYTLLFARHADRVTALDVSDKMLQFLQEEAKQYRLSNVETLESGWPAKLTKQYDVLFAAMCPAVGSEESIRAMDEAAKNVVAIARYDYTADQFIETLSKEEQAEALANDPHNDRAIIDEMEAHAKNLGRTPQRERFTSEEKETMSKEAAKARYNKYRERLPEIAQKLDEAIEQEAIDGRVELVRKFSLTLLYWTVA